jgi:2-methylcitrate dehydratase
VADRIQDWLADYACSLAYEDLTVADVHATKVRIIDTLGACLASFYAKTNRIARATAGRVSDLHGATIFGTRRKTSVEMAAFANSTLAHYAEVNDVAQYAGFTYGHPSDMIMPVLAVAESAKADGNDLLLAVALAYEIHMRLAETAVLHGSRMASFDYLQVLTVGAAAAAGRLMGLSRAQMRQALAIAIVPNHTLAVTRHGHLSMWKAAASGYASRAGVFAAQLAQYGMEGPNLPFEGTCGWSEVIVRQPVVPSSMGGKGVPFRIGKTLIKPRAACAGTISAILAAEDAARKLNRSQEIESVAVESDEKAVLAKATGQHHWNPTGRETADHSMPYVVAAALMDGTLGPRQFDDAHLNDPKLRALLQKVTVTANPEFTRKYNTEPVEHHARVTVHMSDGSTVVGETGGVKGDSSDPPTDAAVESKFRTLAQEHMVEARMRSLLDMLWKVEVMADVGRIPAAFVIEGAEQT